MYRVQRKRGRACGSGCVRCGKHESRVKGKGIGDSRERRCAPLTPHTGSKPHTRTPAHILHLHLRLQRRARVHICICTQSRIPYPSICGAHLPPQFRSCAADGVCGNLRGSRVRSGRGVRSTSPQYPHRRRARSRTAAARSHRRSRSIKGPAAVEEDETDEDGRRKGGGEGGCIRTRTGKRTRYSPQ
jgi:hypothetical protein